MSASIGRLSFIGRRPINFLKADVALTISACTETFQNAKFGKLPFAQTIDASGKFGQFNVKLVDGLRCDIQEGVSRDESRLVLSIDPEKYGAFDKYQRKFLKSMHGTTNSILMSHVEGITEVRFMSLHSAIIQTTVTLRLVHPVRFVGPSRLDSNGWRRIQGSSRGQSAESSCWILPSRHGPRAFGHTGARSQSNDDSFIRRRPPATDAVCRTDPVQKTARALQWQGYFRRQ